MDNSPRTWSPEPAAVAVGGLLAAALIGGAIVTGLGGDRAGLVLFGAGGLLIAALAAFGALIRPRLAADRESITVRTLTGTHRLAWATTRIRLVNTRRFGRESATIEIESGELLIVLGRIDLGADPHDVIDILAALRP